MIDETLWTTQPVGAVFDQSLAVLVGRPLAFVRARLQFLLDGAPLLDPAWQFTFDPNDCSQPGTQTPAITAIPFGIQLGNVAQIDDGLIGYFVGDDYSTFNASVQSGARTGDFIRPIGENDNYLSLPFDGVTDQLVSMLVDPRAGVHATSAILPTVTATLPLKSVQTALARMNITFRVNGGLTDARISSAQETTVLMPVPRVNRGTWTWWENADAGWTAYATAPNDTTARLSDLLPTLRTGVLQLSSALDDRSASLLPSTLPTLPEKKS